MNTSLVSNVQSIKLSYLMSQEPFEINNVMSIYWEGHRSFILDMLLFLKQIIDILFILNRFINV